MIRALTLAALTLATPAVAQPTPPAPPAAATPAPIAPANLAAATRIIARVWPLGTYRRMMDGMMDRIMESTMSSMYAMPVRDMAGMSGASGDAQKALGDKTMGEALAAADPAYRERMKITTKVMTDEMVGMMSDVEPQVQTALARAYAARFTLPQLNDLDRFFATPTGTVYAREAMMLYTDPEMMKAMQAFVPTLMRRMPAIMEKVKAATAHLPARHPAGKEAGLTMRLTPQEIAAIKTSATNAFGEDAIVRLFGSRVHDHLRGGDIDLLIEVDDTHAAQRVEGRFLNELFRHIDEQRVDIVYAGRGHAPAPIVAIALRDGIVL